MKNQSAAAVAVLAVCSLALAGVAYAWNAQSNTDTDTTDFEYEYVTLSLALSNVPESIPVGLEAVNTSTGVTYKLTSDVDTLIGKIVITTKEVQGDVDLSKIRLLITAANDDFDYEYTVGTDSTRYSLTSGSEFEITYTSGIEVYLYATAEAGTSVENVSGSTCSVPYSVVAKAGSLSDENLVTNNVVEKQNRMTAADIQQYKQAAQEDPTVTVKVTNESGASITLCSSALAVLDTTGDAELTVSVVDVDTLDEDQKEIVGDSTVFDISFGDNHDFSNGNITLTIPYTLKTGETADNITVFALLDDGTVESHPCTYDAASQTVTFTTSHLSVYGIATVDKITTSVMDTNDDIEVRFIDRKDGIISCDINLGSKFEDIPIRDLVRIDKFWTSELCGNLCQYLEFESSNGSFEYYGKTLECQIYTATASKLDNYDVSIHGTFHGTVVFYQNYLIYLDYDYPDGHNGDHTLASLYVQYSNLGTIGRVLPGTYSPSNNKVTDDYIAMVSYIINDVTLRFTVGDGNESQDFDLVSITDGGRTYSGGDLITLLNNGLHLKEGIHYIGIYYDSELGAYTNEETISKDGEGLWCAGDYKGSSPLTGAAGRFLPDDAMILINISDSPFCGYDITITETTIEFQGMTVPVMKVVSKVYWEDDSDDSGKDDSGKDDSGSSGTVNADQKYVNGIQMAASGNIQPGLTVVTNTSGNVSEMIVQQVNEDGTVVVMIDGSPETIGESRVNSRILHKITMRSSDENLTVKDSTTKLYGLECDVYTYNGYVTTSRGYTIYKDFTYTVYSNVVLLNYGEIATAVESLEDYLKGDQRFASANITHTYSYEQI